MREFNHLHVHTQYSLLDGLCKIDELMECANKLGQKAIAITDHGNMFGVIAFYKSAIKHGIKPIIGCEMYITSGSLYSKEISSQHKYTHLILLAKDNEGYHNLMKLSGIAYVDGFYYKPRIDYNVLKKHSKGLICLTACMFGAFSSALVRGSRHDAERVIEKLLDIFPKEDLFVELQDHGLREQKSIIPNQISIAEKFGIGIVATNDVHYVHKEDSFYQEILMCIQTQRTIADENRMNFDSNELYLKSGDEMLEIFSFAQEALDNTVKIAARCNVTIEFGVYHLPKFYPQSNESAASYLRSKCAEGLIKRYGDKAETHRSRLEYELDTIEDMGFTDYFLICEDFINYAKSNNIAVGPGRGSAAGSLVSYTLGITNLDPIRFGLVFERFLNRERITMPDIDIDFCYERRNEVISYVVDKYGADKVCQIITFGTLGAKQAIRDVGRALAMPYNEADRVAKLVPNELNITLKDAISTSKELKTLCESDAAIKRLMAIAMKVEGLPRHCSTHAAGVVITDNPLMEYVPLYRSDDAISTQFTMTTLEELGLLKMDFLGLRNLTVIQDTLKIIELNTGNRIDIDKINYDDKGVYSMFHTGDTDGVFQFESYGMRRFIREFKPDSLEDLILAVAVFRPGPMQEIPKLIRNKGNPKNRVYACPELKSILELTYGCIVYQEQVMEIFRKLAGYSLGRADIVRRAMSKKKMDVLKQEEVVFLEGCVKNGIPKQAAQAIFAQTQEFAKYAFNKAHAACYAYIAFQTAYLKHYYKAEFMAALMTSYIDNQNKIIQYINTCEKIGVKVDPPSVNESYERFHTVFGRIIFGLNAVKNVGHSLAAAIVSEREDNGLYSDFDDFVMRLAQKEIINKRAVESLIKAGAFDDFDDRISLLKTYELTINSVLNHFKSNVPGQMSLFDAPASFQEKGAVYASSRRRTEQVASQSALKMEKEVLGLYLSAHPLDAYAEMIKSVSTGYTYEIQAAAEEIDHPKFKDGDIVSIVGIIKNKTARATKKGMQMAVFTLEDLYGSIRVVVFPQQFEKYSSIISEDVIVMLKGEISIQEDEPIQLIVRELARFQPENITQKLYIRLKERSRMSELKRILSENKGDIPVYVYFEDIKQNTIADKALWVNPAPWMIDSLRTLFGEENVVLK